MRNRSAAFAWVLVAVGACRPPGPQPDGRSEPPPLPALVASPVAEARARAIIEAQLDAAYEAGGGDEAEAARDHAVRATFAPDAVISDEGPMQVAADLHASMFWRIAIDTLAAGGTADAVWFVVTFRDVADPGTRNPGSQASWFPARYAGLAVRDRGWKIVAASILVEIDGVHRSKGAKPVPNATGPGRLASLVLDGAALARAVPSTAIVVGAGPDEIGRGPAALGPWASRALALDGAPATAARELAGETWRSLQANVTFAGGDLEVVAFAIRRGDTLAPMFVQYVGR